MQWVFGRNDDGRLDPLRPAEFAHRKRKVTADASKQTEAKAEETEAKRHPDDRPVQSARFLELAKKLEADESGEAFERALDTVIPRKRPR